MWIDIHTILKYMDCVHVLSTLRKCTPNFMTRNTELCLVENRNIVGMIDCLKQTGKGISFIYILYILQILNN